MNSIKVGDVVKHSTDRIGFVIAIEGLQARVRFTDTTSWVWVSELEVM